MVQGSLYLFRGEDWPRFRSVIVPIMNMNTSHLKVTASARCWQSVACGTPGRYVLGATPEVAGGNRVHVQRRNKPKWAEEKNNKGWPGNVAITAPISVELFRWGLQQFACRPLEVTTNARRQSETDVTDTGQLVNYWTSWCIVLGRREWNI